MRWKIEQFVFCDHHQSLCLGERCQQLEPMMAQLLSFFCRHPGELLTKDQLIEQVWLGRVVSDNAISRVITKLRKALGDDPKVPRYIATLPKKGYKFVAHVALLEALQPTVEQAPEQAIAKPEKPASQIGSDWQKPLWPLLFIAVAALVVFAFIAKESNPTIPTFTQAKAVTARAGRESQPNLSPTAPYLLYTEIAEQKMRLWLKSLTTQQEVEINHGQTKNVWVGPADWSNDGSRFVYLVTTPTACQYFVRQFNGLELTPPKHILDCPVGSYGKIIYSHNDQQLIYTKSEGPNSPYSIYSFDINTRQSTRLNQPALVLGGNSQFDLHPFDNKLLISSPTKEQWEGFYMLDLDAQTLKLLFKQDAYICCGVWSQDGQGVMLMGPHPARQILRYQLNGQNPQVVFSSNMNLGPPTRHSNGRDYLFSAGLSNSNIHQYRLSDKSSELLLGGSVEERLAVYNHQGSQIAYIGFASGHEEIWLYRPQAGSTIKLSHFNDDRHYLDLLWSYDDQLLLASTLNAIHLIDINNGQSKALHIPQQEMRGLSFKNNTTIAYSAKTPKGWRTFEYDLITDVITPLTGQWQYVRFSQQPQNTLWLDENGKLFLGETPTPVASHTDLAKQLVLGRHFNLSKTDQGWYWQQYNKQQYTLYYAANEKAVPQALLENASAFFDVSSQAILFSKTEYRNADIYQTNVASDKTP